MLKELAPKYFLEQDYNCAESALLAISEVYGLGLTPEDAKLVGGFGAGMGCEQLCGVLAGCIAALGKMAVTDRAHATEGFKELCAELCQTFEQTLGNTQCAALKPVYRTEETRCVRAVELGLEMFEKFVQDHGLAN